MRRALASGKVEAAKQIKKRYKAFETRALKESILVYGPYKQQNDTFTGKLVNQARPIPLERMSPRKVRPRGSQKPTAKTGKMRRYRYAYQVAIKSPLGPHKRLKEASLVRVRRRGKPTVAKRNPLGKPWWQRLYTIGHQQGFYAAKEEIAGRITERFHNERHQYLKYR